MGADQMHGATTICGFTSHQQPLYAFDQGADSRANQRVVIDYHRPAGGYFADSPSFHFLVQFRKTSAAIGMAM